MITHTLNFPLATISEGLKYQTEVLAKRKHELDLYANSNNPKQGYINKRFEEINNDTRIVTETSKMIGVLLQELRNIENNLNEHINRLCEKTKQTYYNKGKEDKVNELVNKLVNTKSTETNEVISAFYAAHKAFLPATDFDNKKEQKRAESIAKLKLEMPQLF